MNVRYDLNKTLLIVVLLSLFSSQIVLADSRLYRSDTSMPFIKMMLSMMSAMGILDKASGYNNPFLGGGYGGYGGLGPYGSTLSPWNGYTGNPFLRSPWLSSPWLQPSGQQIFGNYPAGASPVWGTPDWGLIPGPGYTYGYSPYGYGYDAYGSRWSSADLDGWVSEPWEYSDWNPDAETNVHSSQVLQTAPQVQTQSQSQAPAPAETPIVQNFNFNVSEDNKVKNQRQSPLAKLHMPQNMNRQSQWQADRQSPLSRHAPKQSARSERTHTQLQNQVTQQESKSRKKNLDKPCITEFCGLKKPNLNGLWLAQDGEMLGIRNKKYLWSDGNSRYLTGQLKVQNEYLLASVKGSEKIMRFKYKLAGNHLLTMQQDGTIREFLRRPNYPQLHFY